MGLELWFPEDVTRILSAAFEQQQNTARAMPALDGEYAAAYQRGFVDALLAVSVAFGIRIPSATRQPERPTTIDNGWR